MAGRICFCGILRQFCTINRYKTRANFIQLTNINAGMLAVVSGRLQNFHIKTYDKPRDELKEEWERDLKQMEEEPPVQEVKDTNETPLTENFVNEGLTPKRKSWKEINSLQNENDEIFGGAMLAPDVEDDGDIIEESYRSTRKLRKGETRKYAALIKGYLRQQRLREALAVLEIQMLKEDRVKPEAYIYGLLIGGCARQGYTRKSFRLYSNMRQRGFKIKPSVYTALFNACANAPTSEDGLTRAHRLRSTLQEHLYEPNVTNYNAMIKAFGRWGDIKTAFSLADEMIDRQMTFSTETYNFLLQACASDKNLGFRHSLLLWHKMLIKGIQPDYFSFKSIIRCVRDCNFGTIESMQQLFQQILNKSSVLVKEDPKYFSNLSSAHLTTDNSNCTSLISQNIDNQIKQIENPISSTMKESISVTCNVESTSDFTLEKNTTNELEIATNSIQNVDNLITELKNPFSITSKPSKNIIALENSLDLNLEKNTRLNSILSTPNLLAAEPTLGSLISLSEVQKPHERFVLLGGLIGFLEQMKIRNITPDIQMFTSLLEVIPPTKAAEKQLLMFVRRIGLKADIDFFNILIKQRSMRFDYEGGKEVLTMIRTAGLSPDIVTYGVLALGCKTVDEARQLLQEMCNKNIRINIEILGAMLRQGMVNNAFPYICDIIQITLDENIKPSEEFLRHLKHFYVKCAKAIDCRYHWTKTKTFQNGYRKFCSKYMLFQEEHKIAHLKLEDAIKKIQARPYQQYTDEQYSDEIYQESLKNVKQSRKQKLRKYIKKIKIDSLQDDEEKIEEKNVMYGRTKTHLYLA